MQIEITNENLRKNLNTLLENSGLSHLSLLGFSKLFGFSRIPHSIKYFEFFFHKPNLDDTSNQREKKEILKVLTRVCSN